MPQDRCKNGEHCRYVHEKAPGFQLFLSVRCVHQQLLCQMASSSSPLSTAMTSRKASVHAEKPACTSSYTALSVALLLDAAQCNAS